MFKNYFRLLNITLCILLIILAINISLSLFAKRNGSVSRFTNSNYGYSINSSTPTPEEVITLIVTGDVMLGRSVMKRTLEVNNYGYSFDKVAEELKASDIVFINLENPIIKDCPIHESGFKFCTNYEVANGLTYAGVDIVNLANNHSGNYGQKGKSETLSFLKQAGISTTGLGALVIEDVRGVRFGFLGFDYVFKPFNQKDLDLIKESKPLVDILILGVHWGDEYKNNANNFQRNLALNFIENGADIIVGHHPHWVQNIECFVKSPSGWTSLKYSGESCPPDSKIVFYSLGNFIFDQMWSEETRKGAVVLLTFEGNLIKDIKIDNTYIRNLGQPEFVK